MSLPPVTTLLLEWRQGNREAGNQLIERMRSELRQIAGNYLRRERPGHVLQPTALVNELYLKLMSGAATPEWRDRAHFLAVASRQLRRILVDYAREKQAAKRGGGMIMATLSEDSAAAAAAVPPPFEEGVLDLHLALDELAELDERSAKVVELRYFGGLTEEEAAEALGISIATLKRDWMSGRAWLVDRLGWGAAKRSNHGSSPPGV